MFLQSTDFQFSVIALCETWLNDGEESLFNLPGFNKFFINREKRGGGLIIFARDNITAHVLPQLTIVNDTSETIFLQLLVKNKSHHLGLVYRIPSSRMGNFAAEFEAQILSHMPNENVIICGDLT